MKHNGIVVIVPAWNEEAAIGAVVRSVKQVLPDCPVLVMDDHSSDDTSRLAEEAGAAVVRLPVHLGLGGCLRTGYRIAWELGCEYVVRVDGDGQHEAGDIPVILEALRSSGSDAVIGSRFIEARGWHSPLGRAIGIFVFRKLLAPVLGKIIHDPTSGFVGVNRRALALFAEALPPVCPEIGALMMLQEKQLRFHEIPCRMHPRRTGRSSFTFVRSVHYTLHVLMGIARNTLRSGILYLRG